MGLSAGSRIGPYEIVSPLGAGGMGEVYRARDTRLDRTVAIKVLNSSLSATPELKARFEREARVISQFQHPHICVLFDVGQHEGADYLVMEYLEGDSLADRLRRGALPLAEVLRIGIEIADALQKAHRAGIIHRDLKPANVMLTKSGAKLLDFGLAKSSTAMTAVAPGSSSVFSAALTLSSPVSPLSSAGAVLGTVQYMSPEQIAGLEADARSDVFALGLVLYEMATGKRAFDGKTQASVAGAILAVEPPAVSSLQPAVPPALDQVVRLCLAKDPEERYQSAHDVKLQLAAIRDGEMQPVSSTVRGGYRERLVWGAAVVAVAFAAWIAVAKFGRAPQPEQAVVAQIAPPQGADFALWGPAPGLPALSPDGKQLAFVGVSNQREQMLWIRPLNSAIPRALPGTEGAGFPFWSPDGRSVAYTANGNLYRIDTAGGPPIELAAKAGHVSSWSDAGLFVFQDHDVIRIPASGGSSQVVMHSFAVMGAPASISWPQLLPDGKHFLFYSVAADTGIAGTYASSLDGAKATLIVPGSSIAVYSAPGYLLFVRDRTLMAQKFDADSLRLQGDAVPLAENVAVNSIGRRGMFATSANGILVYASPIRYNARIAFFDRAGKQVPAMQAEGDFGSPSLSPDGRRLAISISDPATGKPDIWVYELARGLRTRLTFSPDINAAARWLPDGKRVSFVSSRNDGFHIYQKAADGTGSATPILEDSAAEFFPSWSADGRFVAFQRSNGIRAQSPTGPASGEIWAMPLAGERKPFPVVQNGQFASIQPALSPDAKWLAYVSDESGQREIYVVPFPQGSGRWQVSSGGGSWPRWGHDGKELCYLSPDNKIMSAAVAEQGTSLMIGNPQSLFPVSPALGALGSPYDVSVDGKRFVVVTEETQGRSLPFTVIVNWPALLEKH